jgi:hypothetical protein
MAGGPLRAPAGLALSSAIGKKEAEALGAASGFPPSASLDDSAESPIEGTQFGFANHVKSQGSCQ